jgi:ribonuclease HII
MSDIVSVIIESDDEDEEPIQFRLQKQKQTQHQQQQQTQKQMQQEEKQQTQKQMQQEEKQQEQQEQEQQQKEQVKISKKRNVKPKVALNICFNENPEIIEIGVDESGRGPLFGRVYASAVVLPKTHEYKHENMKDSKKFHSKTKIKTTSEYIKQNAIAWSVKYEDENSIDEINILQATQKAMHECINDVICQLTNKFGSNLNLLLLIDGNYFKPYYTQNNHELIQHHTIEQGDDKFTSIAAASILAKVDRDEYIDELCEMNPELKEKYKIDSNKGYGSKAHIDGIKRYGITPWHRKTFGICREYC